MENENASSVWFVEQLSMKKANKLLEKGR